VILAQLVQMALMDVTVAREVDGIQGPVGPKGELLSPV
jgi:hypothetical protein